MVYGLAGRVDIDLENEPIGQGTNGPVYFKGIISFNILKSQILDIWPSNEEISKFENEFVKSQMFREVYAKIELGSEQWQNLNTSTDSLYNWDPKSTYIKNPPFFDSMTKSLPQQTNIENAYVLLNLGDSVTTDHISPAGSISRISPAAKYLLEHDVTHRDFNSYGSRRGHDEVMVRGTFANIRLNNKLASKTGPKTLHIPSGKELDVYDAAALYQKDKQPVIILAGSEYGSGSSRDWAAKGPLLQGVKCVIAVSFERIHRSNLIGMGIIPLQFVNGQNADNLGLSGKERYTILLPSDAKPGQIIQVKVINYFYIL